MADDRSTFYDLERLRHRARPMELRHVRIAASTNDWARQEVEAGAVRAPTLLVADSQSAGRGRGANSWWSPPGNIAATLVISQNPHIAFGLVPLLAGLAVRRALVNATACEDIGLKWPNDLVARASKAGGLLCERMRRVDLIGVGVNVNASSGEAPAELRKRIISLREITGQAQDLTAVLGDIGRELHRVLTSESEDKVREMLQEYALHHWPTGKDIELIETDNAAHVRGRCLGINPQGQLMVKTERETLSFLTGSIASVTSATDSKRA